MQRTRRTNSKEQSKRSGTKEQSKRFGSKEESKRPGNKEQSKRFGSKDNFRQGNKATKDSRPERPEFKSYKKPSSRQPIVKQEEPQQALEAKPQEGVFGGRRAVLEALKSGNTINKIFVSDGEKEGSIKEIVALAKEKKLPIVYVDKNKLQELLPDQKHQGVAVSVPPVDYVDVDDVLKNETSSDIIILLDGIEDPHNLGAIIRTAEVVGAKGVIIPKRRGVLLTETVAKSSAGAVHHLPVARVANLVQTVEYLKEKGYWVMGADMDGKVVWQENLKQPLVLVIGGEGKGISRLLKEHCDFLTAIPVYGKISSLNASVAAGILLYEIARQNPK